MATISPSQAKNQVSQTDIGAACAGGGDEFVWNGQPCLMIFDNNDASAKTVTIVTQQASATDPSAGPVTIANRTIVIAAGQVGVFPVSKADNLLNGSGRIAVTYSAVTNLKCSIVSL